MQRSDKSLFCYFSGYAQLTVTVTYNGLNAAGAFQIDGELESSRELKAGEHIQLNGVLFVVTRSLRAAFSASTSVDLLVNTALNPVIMPQKLHLGMLAEYDEAHDHLWMLQPSACGFVKYTGYSTREDRESLKLDFEVSSAYRFANTLVDYQHIGLDGTSLTVRELKRETHLTKFSIYCGSETREKTRFNENLAVGTLINFTEPAAVVKIVKR